MFDNLSCRMLACVMLVVSFSAGSTSAQSADKQLERLESGVVRIVAQTRKGISTGSGFVINQDGYVVTNFHVIEGASVIGVTNAERDEIVEVKEVVWDSSGKDLAILKLELPVGKPVVLSTSALTKGAGVIAVGYPGVADRAVSDGDGLFGSALTRDATITKGVIGRSFEGPWNGVSGESVHILQHSAQINGGNSGGPLFDECGRVIGVNTQGATRQASGAAATGVFWASNISELVDILDRKSIGFSSVASICNVSGNGWDSRTLLLVSISLLSLATAIYAVRKPVQVAVEKVSSRRVSRLAEPSSDRDQTGRAGRASRKAAQAGTVVLSGIGENGEIIHLSIDPRAAAGSRDGFVIGRHPGLCHGVVDHSLVSKRQARIFVDQSGHLMVEDLHATNPTRLNGRELKPYEPVALQNRQALLLGNVELSVAI